MSRRKRSRSKTDKCTGALHYLSRAKQLPISAKLRLYKIETNRDIWNQNQNTKEYRKAKNKQKIDKFWAENRSWI